MSDQRQVLYEKRDSIAILRVNNPPVNALSTAMLAELSEAFGWAEQDDEVRAIVLIGVGRTFIAGADIRELEEAAWGGGRGGIDAHPLLRQMEESATPIVVAIHGTALGGGVEVAMAGHYRVAVASAQLGFPEVNLGIIPGAEGTQRLPRLVGVEKAIEMCISGRPIGASDALAAGLIDEILDGELEAGATEYARAVVARGGPHRKTSERGDRIGSPEAAAPLLDAGRELARKTRRHQVAPLAAVDAIAAAATLPFAEGIRRERELFERCLASDQCRALLHVFFAERAVARIPNLSPDTQPRPVHEVAIIGAGTMGGGIAMACANAGLQVRLVDSTREALDSGMGRVRANYETSARRGRFSAAEVEQRLALISPQLDHSGMDEVDLVIEAVFESMELKKRIFSELDAVVRPGCVLGTNTSTLDIDEIAAVTSRPRDVIGLHFFSPANVMRLLEIVRGRETAPEVIATAMALAKQLRKVGVLVGNGPGFVGNRMMFPYMYEAQFLVEEGATPEQVDAVLTEFGMAMGIFAVDDMAGLDVSWRVRRELNHFSDADARRPLVVDRLNEMGRLGQKTGAGWYRYEGGRQPIPDPEVLALIEDVSREAGLERRSISAEGILERTVFALINEGARVLDEGLASRASDIDVIYVNGYGFPAWRGGPMFHADAVGLGNIAARLSDLERQHGARWRPAPLLVRLAAEERTFRDYDAGHGRSPAGRPAAS
jgi:3-hydroxyacyl-CoA dehydrogenase